MAKISFQCEECGIFFSVDESESPQACPRGHKNPTMINTGAKNSQPSDECCGSGCCD